MNPFHRKSKMERLLESLESQEILKTAVRSAIERAVANAGSPQQAQKVGEVFDSLDPKPTKASPLKGRARSGLALAAGVAAVTAASASISSIRNRQQQGSTA